MYYMNYYLILYSTYFSSFIGQNIIVQAIQKYHFLYFIYFSEYILLLWLEYFSLLDFFMCVNLLFHYFAVSYKIIHIIYKYDQLYISILFNFTVILGKTFGRFKSMWSRRIWIRWNGFTKKFEASWSVYYGRNFASKRCNCITRFVSTSHGTNGFEDSFREKSRGIS